MPRVLPLRWHAVEEIDHTSLERVFRTDHEESVVLDELFEHFRAVAQVVGRHADIGAHRLLLETLPVARWIALEQLTRPSREQSRNLRSIVDRIRPAVAGLLERDPPPDRQTLERQAVRANIRMSANHLRHGSEVLEQLIQTDELLVVGAEYSLETGVVDFFDGVPPQRMVDAHHPCA